MIAKTVDEMGFTILHAASMLLLKMRSAIADCLAISSGCRNASSFRKLAASAVPAEHTSRCCVLLCRVDVFVSW